MVSRGLAEILPIPSASLVSFPCQVTCLEHRGMGAGLPLSGSPRAEALGLLRLGPLAVVLIGRSLMSALPSSEQVTECQTGVLTCLCVGKL